MEGAGWISQRISHAQSADQSGISHPLSHAHSSAQSCSVMLLEYSLVVVYKEGSPL